MKLARSGLIKVVSLGTEEHRPEAQGFETGRPSESAHSQPYPEEHRPEAQGFETCLVKRDPLHIVWQRNTAPRRRGLKLKLKVLYNCRLLAEEHRPEAQGFETSCRVMVAIGVPVQRNTAPRRRGLKLADSLCFDVALSPQRNTAPRRRGLKPAKAASGHSRRLTSEEHRPEAQGFETPVHRSYIQLVAEGRGTPPRGAGV